MITQIGDALAAGRSRDAATFLRDPAVIRQRAMNVVNRLTHMATVSDSPSDA